MAAVTLELVVCHVVFVNKFRRILYSNYFRFIVTLHAAVGGDVPIALNHVEMALPAGDAFFNVSSMIKGIPIDVYVPLGLRVARRALSDRT